MTNPLTGTRAEGLAARRARLDAEKASAWRSDALARQRRALRRCCVAWLLREVGPIAAR